MAEHFDDSQTRAICAGCIGESYLSALVKRDGKKRTCRYCGKKGRNSFTVLEMSECIQGAFNHHYSRTPVDMNSYERMAHNDPESNYSWDREGEPTVDAIMNAAEIPFAAAQDIQRILDDQHGDWDASMMVEETEFCEDAHYEEIMPGDTEWQEGWRAFERSIKSEARFFSRSSAEKLGLLFNDIDTLRTRDNRPLIADAGPGTSITHLYRARVFQSHDKLVAAMIRPDQQLAAPPSNFAAAGRMNAKGISTFYGSTNSEIAMAEVRPPVGSKVTVARFDIVRPVRLLDLTALSTIIVAGSIFDPNYARQLGRMIFLKSLRDRMSRPVMPDDQDFDYLVTQAVADFLATEGKIPLDGILFPSVQSQAEGLNVVLFQKASRCAEAAILPGTDIEARTFQDTEDGPEIEYSVIEWLPPKAEKEPDEKPVDPFDDFEFFQSADPTSIDPRAVTLEIAMDVIHVHHVEATKFITTEFPVSRRRYRNRVHDDY